MLSNGLRGLELAERRETALFALCCGQLAQLGHPEAANEAFLKRIKLLSGLRYHGPAAQLERQYLGFLLAWDPAKAWPLAEEVLKSEPKNAYALAALMLREASRGNGTVAMAVATKILEVDKDKNSHPNKLARALLAKAAAALSTTQPTTQPNKEK